MNDMMDSTMVSTEPLAPPSNITKLYTRRWIVLIVFSLVSMLNSFNWIEYSIIQDVTIAFFNKSLPEDPASKTSAVNWFSMVFMLSYIPLVFPAMFFLDRKGLKLSLILGALLTAVGAIIKCFAVNPNLFLLAMLGQTICSLGQTFTLSMPARLSAVWFSANEVSLATSIGVFGNQLGTAFGFLIPPNLVHIGTIDEMTREFSYLMIGGATACCIALILTIIFVKNQPELPPSASQLEVRNNMSTGSANQNDTHNFKTSLFVLIKNPNFLLLLFSYGVNVGVYYAISTLLNQIVSEYYKNQNELIGVFGLILIISGCVGAIIGGFILDKSKKFKLVTTLFYVGSFLSMLLFTATLSININIIFVTSALLGFFMTGYLPVGFELAAEITYPEPEGLSCGLLNSSAQLFGVLFTFIQGRILTSYGAFVGNVFLCVSLVVGIIMTVLVKADLRRQRSDNSDNEIAPINQTTEGSKL